MIQIAKVNGELKSFLGLNLLSHLGKHLSFPLLKFTLGLKISARNFYHLLVALVQI